MSYGMCRNWFCGQFIAGLGFGIYRSCVYKVKNYRSLWKFWPVWSCDGIGLEIILIGQLGMVGEL